MQLYEIIEDRSIEPLMFGLQTLGGEQLRRLTTDYAEIERLARMCNELQLSPIHFYDVLDDFRRS